MSHSVIEKHLKLLAGIPVIHSPFFEEICQSGYFSEDEQAIAMQLHSDGYALIDFPDPAIHQKAQKIVQDMAPLFAAARDGGERFDGKLMPPRFQDAYDVCPDVKSIAANPPLLDLLKKLYGRQAFPFQTLTFQQGSQQHVHSDAVHFNSYPKGFMCGVWVALEDVNEQNGPVIYHPGSHRWAVYDNEQTVESREDAVRPASQAAFHDLWNELIKLHGSKAVSFCPRRGQALIWTANLLHGGAEIINADATRWSQVTHYFFENSAFYRPMASHLLPGHIAFMNVTNILTDTAAQHEYCRTALPQEYVSAAGEREFASVEADPLPEDFVAERYLELNPDVATAGADPESHYLIHGRLEGRRFK